MEEPVRKRRPAIEQLESETIALRVRLAGIDILCPNDELEQRPDFRLLERSFDLLSQGAAHHTEGETGVGGLNHQFDPAWKKRVAISPHSVAVVGGLASDQPNRMRGLEFPTHRSKHGTEALRVIEAEVVLPVVLTRECDAFFV
jgi:hypothetical protein